jgi:hydroxypyruvate reductase
MPDIDILVTAPFPEFLAAPLKRDYRCHDYLNAKDKAALLKEVAPRIRGLAQGGQTITPQSLIDALPALEIISVFGVGYDGVPVARCRERGIKVTHTPDVLTDDVADVAVGLVLMTGRGFAKADRFVRAGLWEKGSFELTTKISGKTAGLIGLGRIGRAVAKRLAGLDMKIAYTDQVAAPGVPYEFVPDLIALAQKADFLVVACPGGPSTRGLVNASVLAALGKKGTLINIARGTIVDEPALVAALVNGTIKAAGLDVFLDEPHVPKELLTMDNVVLTPHLASGTNETRQAMGDLCKANLDAWFGEKRTLTSIPEFR